MPNPEISAGSNLLLDALSPDDRRLLDPHLVRVDMKPRQFMVEADKPIEHIYFLNGGIASIVSSSPDEGHTEIGIFGREGMSGTTVLLGSDRSPYDTFIQVDGSTALRMEVGALHSAIEQSATLHNLLLRFAEALMIQTGQSVVASAHHRVESRLARWLLMCHDRSDGDDIALTHEFMSMMIAAQRTGVTVTLHILEGSGMIRSTRGLVTILDRAKLEDIAGDAYGMPEAEYRRLIGPFGHSAV